MRLFGRQDPLLILGLAAAAAVILARPISHLIDLAYEVQRNSGLALIPAFVILMFVFIVHQQGKRQQMKAAAVAAAATAEEARARTLDMEQLVTFGQALARSLDSESIREAMHQHLPRFAGCDDVWALVRSDGHWMALMGGGGFGKDQQRAIQGTREQLADRTLSLESDRRTETDGMEWEGQICFPMIAAGVAIGVIGVPETARLSDGQRRMLAAGSALLAVSLKNAQLFREVRDNSLRDGLTGLVNKTHAIEMIDTELRRARRSQAPLSLIMFDIDRFKDVNDRYGHLCGDAVLAAVARRTREVLRGSDLKARYGGEEFLVLLPDTPLEGSKRVAETLRREIAETAIPWNNDTITVSASFGVAVALPAEVDPSALIGRADQALYRAKEEGRNCVRIAADMANVA